MTTIPEKEVLMTYDKALESLKSKDYDKAIEYFEKVCESDKNHYRAHFRIFLGSLLNQEEDKVIESYRNLLETGKSMAANDGDFYLFLLSMTKYVNGLSEEEKERAKSIKFKDIMITEQKNRYNNRFYYNELRLSIAFHKFSYAIKQLAEIINRHGYRSPEDLATNLLMHEAQKTKIAKEAYIYEKMKEKKYDEVIDYLEKEKNIRQIREKDEAIILILKEYKKIIETKQIPEISDTDTYDLLKAIKIKNYQKAMELAKTNSDAIFSKDIYEVLVKINYEIAQANKDEIKLTQISEKLKMLEQQEVNIELHRNKTDEFERELHFYVSYLKAMKAGMVIVNELNEEQKEDFCSMAKELNDIEVFEIKNEYMNRLVLRYISSRQIDVKKEFKEANAEFEKQNFFYSKIIMSKIIRTEAPSYLVYVRLGDCYFRLKQYYNALVCYEIAESIINGTNNEKIIVKKRRKQ